MDDFIKRSDMQDMLSNAQIICDSAGEFFGYCTEDVDVSKIKSADVRENIRAQWIPNKKELRIARCSYCNHIQTVNGVDKTGHCYIHKAIYRYCPHCGAYMRGE